MPLLPKILSDIKLVNKARPNLKAKIYFVYISRSVCPVCVQETPALVKEYKKMKRMGCEMVMLNIDASAEAAAAWAKRAKMDFPVVDPSISTRSGIPWNFTGSPMLPSMIAMTPDGSKLDEASGAGVTELV